MHAAKRNGKQCIPLKRKTSHHPDKGNLEVGVGFFTIERSAMPAYDPNARVGDSIEFDGGRLSVRRIDAEYMEIRRRVQKNTGALEDDVVVEKEDRDVFKVHVFNCPFCEAFNALRMPELSPYVCEGDWEKARANKKKWDFERKHQIGTGDSFCDHTYKRKTV